MAVHVECQIRSRYFGQLPRAAAAIVFQRETSVPSWNPHPRVATRYFSTPYSLSLRHSVVRPIPSAAAARE